MCDQFVTMVDQSEVYILVCTLHGLTRAEKEETTVTTHGDVTRGGFTHQSLLS